MTKVDDYARLVADRKACRLCHELTNPSHIDDGRLDSEQVGPWSRWQGNLDARVMVVGQDWGDTSYFLRFKGLDGPANPTNLALVELLQVAGVSIDGPHANGDNTAFFTNAILCLKSGEGGLQAQVQSSWFDNCAPFLRRQIEIVSPSVVVGLGERAYRAILAGFGISSGPFRAEVEQPEGRVLPNGVRAFAMYHCGTRIQNTHRPMAAQREDWKRLRPFVPELAMES